MTRGHRKVGCEIYLGGKTLQGRSCNLPWQGDIVRWVVWFTLAERHRKVGHIFTLVGKYHEVGCVIYLGGETSQGRSALPPSRTSTRVTFSPDKKRNNHWGTCHTVNMIYFPQKNTKPNEIWMYLELSFTLKVEQINIDK